MDYVNLGKGGLRVSRVCLGMMSYGKHASREWALDETEAEPIVRRAIEAGISFFDTADAYNGGQSEIRFLLAGTLDPKEARRPPLPKGQDSVLLPSWISQSQRFDPLSAH